MYKVQIRPHWEIAHNGAVPFDTAELLFLLTAIQQTGSIAQAAQQLRHSYRHAWGLLRTSENTFGHALIDSDRGRGTTLTVFAEKLLWADRLVNARLSPTLDSLASELEIELGKTVEGKLQAVRMNASHGFAVNAVLKLLEQAGIPIEIHYRHSTDALAALARQECDLAGFHVPLGKFQKPAMQTYSKWLEKRHDFLLHLAIRDLGLFVATGNPKDIKGLSDLARTDLRFVNREAGSGTRMLLELMLADAKIAQQQIIGFSSNEFTHSAVAAFIASGMADVGFGVKTAAHHFGLEFIPLVRERYFFAMPATALSDPLLHAVIDILQSPACRTAIDKLPGYDGTDSGKIQTIAEAFAQS